MGCCEGKLPNPDERLGADLRVLPKLVRFGKRGGGGGEVCKRLLPRV